MSKLWGGRFTKKTDQLVEEYTASISFDKELAQEDIQGSLAHVTMLGKQGILLPKTWRPFRMVFTVCFSALSAGKSSLR